MGDRQTRVLYKFAAHITILKSSMPDPRTLGFGNGIRILCVPTVDVDQRERAEKTGWAADSIERIVVQSPVVCVSRIDEYGCVW